MAAEWTFDPGIVIDDDTLDPQANATGIFALTVGGAAEPVFDLNASPIANLISNERGYVGRFKANHPVGFVNFGSVWQPVVAFEVFQNAASIAALTAAAQAAQAAAEGVLAVFPTGGALGQILAKASTADYDAEWINQINPQAMVTKTPAEWASSPLILAYGQPGLSHDAATTPDTWEIRFGDGANLWPQLGGVSGGGGGDWDQADFSVIGLQIAQASGQPAALTILGLDWLKVGSGSPEGVVTASPGALYRNTAGGGNTTLWIKETGTGNTGWVAYGGVATKASVGLSNVDNTSDANKPVSTAQQAINTELAFVAKYDGTSYQAVPTWVEPGNAFFDSIGYPAAPAPAAGARPLALNRDKWFPDPSVV